MKTVENNKNMMDENESEEKILSFEELEATVEPLILPCCEFYQTHERTRDNHKKCMAKCTSALTFIIDFLKRYDRVETRPEFKTFDSVVCFDSLMFCLEKYQPIEKSFMRMFVYVYFKLKKAHSRFLFDRMCRVNADIAYYEIRKAIRERMKEAGISGPQATEMLHSFFSVETYLYANSRKRFFRTKLHLSENQIDDFEYTLQANGFVDSLDRIKEKIGLEDSEYREIENSLAPMEREAALGDNEPEDAAESLKEARDEENADKIPCEFEYKGKAFAEEDFTERKESWEDLIITTEKSFALAKSKKERAYLRCFLTLIVLKELQADTISIRHDNEILSRLAAYIDKPFLLKHWQDDYSKDYQEALEEAGRSGKTIREEAFYKAARQEAMARHLDLEPSTIKSYCVRGYNMMTAVGESLHLAKKDPPPLPEDESPLPENESPLPENE